MIGKGLDCLYPIYVKYPIQLGDFDITKPEVLDSYAYKEAKYLEKLHRHDYIRVRCNRCINCKIYRSREWCLRLAMESKYWKDICFVTLTYDNSNVPVNYVSFFVFGDSSETSDEEYFKEVLTLDTKAIQLFLKRLRKQLDYKIRYYAVGEYGSRTQRPHFHIMFFGLKPEDYHLIGYTLVEQAKKINISEPRYVAWHYGHIDIRPFFPETCTYIAGYIQKKLYGNAQNPFRVPEFMRCSQHIGEQWILDHLEQFDDEHAYIPYQGYNHPIPKVFREKLYHLGYLNKMCLNDFYYRQRDEYFDLLDSLNAQGIDIETYFKQRRKDALAKQKRISSSRDKNTEV